MSKWQEKTKRPVLPIYMAALVWPVGALLLPPYRLSNLLILAGLSLIAYAVGTKLCPTRVVRTLIPYATGSEDVDAMLNGIAANLDALHKLNEAIPDPQLSAAMERMEKAGRSIAAVVEKAPDKARAIDRFARYYLPETVKLMATYAALEQNGVKGENAPRSNRSCAAMPRPPRPPLKTSLTRCTARRQWIFLLILRCWTVS